MLWTVDVDVNGIKKKFLSLSHGATAKYINNDRELCDALYENGIKGLIGPDFNNLQCKSIDTKRKNNIAKYITLSAYPHRVIGNKILVMDCIPDIKSYEKPFNYKIIMESESSYGNNDNSSSYVHSDNYGSSFSNNNYSSSNTYGSSFSNDSSSRKSNNYGSSYSNGEYSSSSRKSKGGSSSNNTYGSSF